MIDIDTYIYVRIYVEYILHFLRELYFSKVHFFSLFSLRRGVGRGREQEAKK